MAIYLQSSTRQHRRGAQIQIYLQHLTRNTISQPDRRRAVLHYISLVLRQPEPVTVTTRSRILYVQRSPTRSFFFVRSSQTTHSESLSLLLWWVLCGCRRDARAVFFFLRRRAVEPRCRFSRHWSNESVARASLS